MYYLIANWKANKSFQEANLWLSYFKKNYQPSKNVKVIICPPFPLIYPLFEKLKKISNLFLGAQDLSFYEEGSFTGEVTAKMLVGLINYVIIGHSERRTFFHETEEIIDKKVNLAFKYSIEPILCLRNLNDKINPKVNFIAYEPPFAIGSGKNEDPKKVIEFKKKLNIKKKFTFIYGGSVNEKNINNYLNSEIDGFLLGTSSLNPEEFINIFNKLKKSLK